MSSDLVPQIETFRPIVLRLLKDGEARSAKDIQRLAAEAAGLSEAATGQVIASGQPRYVNRVSWACSSLAVGGLLERPRRGWYQITDNGRAVESRNLSAYSEQDMLEWPIWQAYQRELEDRKRASGDNDASLAAPATEPVSLDPLEAIEESYKAFNDHTETRLRRRLQEASPDFFEKAVVDLLWAMGYGGSHGEKQRVGKSGDNGIDGIIRQDALGLSNVYIQAKRYSDSNPVGSPAIRDFIGALDSHGATQGVFITTSRFSSSAANAANNYRHGKIVLIDGIRLTTLLVDYSVAVRKVKEFTLYDVDEEYFEADLD
ncbi:restriction endonuclease [Leucobacter sp. cx-42]|uniref:restriction endonuclease n=1 Tax=unclassified Leucobacter TaxID=2621730 RepID=UPI00165E3F0C|nr:restriction endonuclease [Leucobacter sp. cx-42]